ncbi:hypothetical protein MMC15_000584 [Xylographa vitiligo]|nr:hypothetical protein [Xylographa vitiligo]
MPPMRTASTHLSASQEIDAATLHFAQVLIDANGYILNQRLQDQILPRREISLRDLDHYRDLHTRAGAFPAPLARRGRRPAVSATLANLRTGIRTSMGPTGSYSPPPDHDSEELVFVDVDLGQYHVPKGLADSGCHYMPRDLIRLWADMKRMEPITCMDEEGRLGTYRTKERVGNGRNRK